MNKIRITVGLIIVLCMFHLSVLTPFAQNENVKYTINEISAFVPSITMVDGNGVTTESVENSRSFSIAVYENENGRFAYIGNNLALFVYDVTDKENPVKLQQCDKFTGEYKVVCSNDMVYVSNTSDSKLYRFEIKNNGTLDIPDDLTNAVSISLKDSNAMQSSGGCVFVLKNNRAVNVINSKTDAFNFTEIKSYDSNETVKKIKVKEFGGLCRLFAIVQRNNSDGSVDFCADVIDYDIENNTFSQVCSEIIPQWTAKDFWSLDFLDKDTVLVSAKESSTLENIYIVNFSDDKIEIETYLQSHSSIAYAGYVQTLYESEAVFWNTNSYIKDFDDGCEYISSSSTLGKINRVLGGELFGDVSNEAYAYLACDSKISIVSLKRERRESESVTKPIIINNTWNGKAGDAVAIYGCGFVRNGVDTDVILMPVNDHNSDSAVMNLYFLDIHNINNTCIQGSLPADMVDDCYVGYVKVGESYSEVFKINTPELDWISDPEICIGQTVRAFGRNLVNPATKDCSKTKVWLQNISNGTMFEAEVVNADEYTVDFIIPTDVEIGEKYTVKVSNDGDNDFTSYTLDECESVECVSASNFSNIKEQFGVEIAWADQIKTNNTFNVKTFGAKGNGTTDDTNAIKDALSSASSGGIIYFPEGKYVITSDIKLPDGSIIMGDGIDKTVLLTDNRISSADNYSGIYNLTLKSKTVRPDDDTERRIAGYTGGHLYGNGDNVHFFVKNFKLDVSDGSGFVSYAAKHLVIEDSSFIVSHTGILQQLQDKYAATKMRFRNNYVYNTQRPLLMCGGHSWVDGNTFEGNNAGDRCEKNSEGIVSAMEHRICDLYGDKIYYGQNHIIGTIGDQREGFDDNSGEGICNQAAIRIALGSVGSATQTTFQTPDKDFDIIASGLDAVAGNNGKYLIGANVVIMSGNGMGQKRKIIAAAGNTVTIDRAWDVIPQKGDTYSINGEIAYRYIIVNNNIEAKTRKGGIMLYTSSYDSVIDNNTMTNGGGIWFGKSQDISSAKSDFAYFNYVADNVLSGGILDKENGARDNTLYIGVGDDGGAITNIDVDFQATSQYANMYKENIIKGNGTNFISDSEYNKKFVNYNGFVMSTQQHGMNYPFAKGNILMGNKVTNSVNGVVVSNTSFDTLLYNNLFEDNGANYNNTDSKNTVLVMPVNSKQEDKYRLFTARYNADGRLLSLEIENEETAYQRYILNNLDDGTYVKLMVFSENLKPLRDAILLN